MWDLWAEERRGEEAGKEGLRKYEGRYVLGYSVTRLLSAPGQETPTLLVLHLTDISEA